MLLRLGSKLCAIIPNVLIDRIVLCAVRQLVALLLLYLGCQLCAGPKDLADRNCAALCCLSEGVLVILNLCKYNFVIQDQRCEVWEKLTCSKKSPELLPEVQLHSFSPIDIFFL